MATTDNFPLPLPPDSTLIKDMALMVRESNTVTDAVLAEQGSRVGNAERAALDSETAARAAADLAGAPADPVVAALLAGSASATAGAVFRNASAPFLGPLRSWGTAIRGQATAPAIWVNLGDSIANAREASTTSRRWHARIAALLGPRPVIEGLETAPPANGVQVYNAAIGGTYASNYMTDAMRDRIIALRPQLVTHLIGSNDWAGNRTPAAYKADLLRRVTEIHAGTSAVQLLISPHQRFDIPNPAYPWAQYETAMAEVAAQFPGRVAFLNMAEIFAAMGPTDRHGLWTADRVHLNDAGQKVMAEIIGAAIGAPPAYFPYEVVPFVGAVAGGTFNTDGKVFAELRIPAKPYLQRVVFHAALWAAGTGASPDIALFIATGSETGKEEGRAFRAPASAAVATGHLTAVVLPNTVGVFQIRYNPNGGQVTLSNTAAYSSIYAEVSPV